MNRRLIVSLVMVITATTSLVQAGPSKPKATNTLFYEAKLSSPLGNMGKRSMYMKGSNFVFIADTPGIKLKFIKNQDGAFLIHNKGLFAGKYPPESNRNSPMAFLPGPIGDVKEFLAKENAKKQGTEKVAGKTCDFYKYTEKTTGWNCKLWVQKNTFAPVKLLMTGKKKNETINAVYLSYKLGADVQDSLFKLPAGIAVRPMPSGTTNRTISSLDKFRAGNSVPLVDKK